jgi:sulfoxide reductase heme-binding subunit YedZ
VNRRFLGVVTFLYLVAHLFFYLVMEGLEPQAFTQLYSKLYLALGFSAWLILLALALTSNNFSVRKLGGRRWKRLHRSVYAASALITVHILLIEKADLVKFYLLFALLWMAMLARLARFCWQRFGPIARSRA